MLLCVLPLLMALPLAGATYRLGSALQQALQVQFLDAAQLVGTSAGISAATSTPTLQWAWMVLAKPPVDGSLDQVLAGLREQRLQAVVFVPAPWLDQQPLLIERLVGEGHRIGLLLPQSPRESLWVRWRVWRDLTRANLWLGRRALAPIGHVLPLAAWPGSVDGLQWLPGQAASAPSGLSIPSHAAVPLPWLLQWADALWPWLLRLFHALVGLMCVYGVAMLVLAQMRRKVAVKPPADAADWPSISVLVPAYNEAKVICATLRSLLGSDYAGPLEILVIDDGSSDGTAALVREHFGHEPRVRVFDKPNGGKASALNLGLAHAAGELVAVIDADTLLHAMALQHLAVNFIDPRVGAVAGNMQVGNLISELTRLQAIEYACANHIERRAQEVLGCMTVVPGAIGAYRRGMLRALGGYHADTLAEDADLTVRILRAGWRVVYEERALARTEAPHCMRDFMKQRLRWSFGKLQVVWKHRAAFCARQCLRLGWIGLPSLLLFNFALPPLAWLLSGMRGLVLVLLCLAPDWQADLSLLAPSVQAPLSGLLLEVLALGVLARVSIYVSRRCDRRVPGAILLRPRAWRRLVRYLAGTPMRVLMGWALTFTAYRSLARALSGKATHWNKVQRTASVTADFGTEFGTERLA